MHPNQPENGKEQSRVSSASYKGAENDFEKKLTTHKLELERLEYTIDSYSSYSSNYHPRNIMVRRPEVQSSRWSSASNNRSQFIILKLSSPAIVQTIMFGKYYKSHVCNLKEFKIFGGLTTSNMVELLHNGLTNDSESETFNLRPKYLYPRFPCEYIKIVPLQTWGVNFSFSIWHIELRGISDPGLVKECYDNYTNETNSAIIRLCLKYMRQKDYLDAFNVIQKTTGIMLEDPLLTELYEKLVVEGDFDSVEKIFKNASEAGLLDECTNNADYLVFWERILSDTESPYMRGGHQMCVDTNDGSIYLFGGWDGYMDLSDFWVFKQDTRKWECISRNTERRNGPGPRSCHKLCFDPVEEQIYLLGKYTEISGNVRNSVKNDFWKYEIKSNKWTLISPDTFSTGGPRLIYDHQMVIDPEKRMIYVFGGRTCDGDSLNEVYSGLYSYSIEEDKWKLILSDSTKNKSDSQLNSRIGHTMLFNSKTRDIYVFSGQRNRDNLTEFFIFEVDSKKIYAVSRDYTKQSGPEPGLTQRSVINAEDGHIYVLGCLTREKSNCPNAQLENVIWVYDINKETWTKINQEDPGTKHFSGPIPRFAHQLVFNPLNKKMYLFGGNPGKSDNPQLRLDDFWELTLTKNTTKDIISKVILETKSEKFKEMCYPNSTPSDKIKALVYLRKKASPLIAGMRKRQIENFESLILELFKPDEKDTSSAKTSEKMKMFNNAVRQSRIKLYESFIEYFPEKTRQPKTNLVDIVRFT